MTSTSNVENTGEWSLVTMSSVQPMDQQHSSLTIAGHHSTYLVKSHNNNTAHLLSMDITQHVIKSSNKIFFLAFANKLQDITFYTRKLKEKGPKRTSFLHQTKQYASIKNELLSNKDYHEKCKPLFFSVMN